MRSNQSRDQGGERRAKGKSCTGGQNKWDCRRKEGSSMPNTAVSTDKWLLDLDLMEVIGSFGKNNVYGMVRKKALWEWIQDKMKEQMRRQWVEINFMEFHCKRTENENFPRIPSPYRTKLGKILLLHIFIVLCIFSFQA